MHGKFSSVQSVEFASFRLVKLQSDEELEAANIPGLLHLCYPLSTHLYFVVWRTFRSFFLLHHGCNVIIHYFALL